MPSKCLLKQLDESIEDIKLIHEFYRDEGAPGIVEMIPPVKYLIACIADILNDGIIEEGTGLGFGLGFLKMKAKMSSKFYSHFKQFKEISLIANNNNNNNLDEFDMGLIWIIQRLNCKDLSITLKLNQNYLFNTKIYSRNSILFRRNEDLLKLIENLEKEVYFDLKIEDLYNARMRCERNIPDAPIKQNTKDIDIEIDKIKLKFEDKHHFIENEKDLLLHEISRDKLPNEIDDVMTSSFISMKAVDVKLLQEREMRNDFGVLNQLKYTTIRFFTNLHLNFKASSTRSLRLTSGQREDSDVLNNEFDNVEIVSIPFESDSNNDYINNSNGRLLNMKICPERGLDAQNYSCSECGTGISFKNSIKCDFSGNYLCLKCHGGEEFINPVRILRNWDFKTYPICQTSRKTIVEISYKELFNFSEINPKTFNSSEIFKLTNQMREKIYKASQKRLQAAGNQDRKNQRKRLERLAWPKIHLLTSTNLYTIEDLIEIERGIFYQNVLFPLYNLLKL